MLFINNNRSTPLKCVHVYYKIQNYVLIRMISGILGKISSVVSTDGIKCKHLKYGLASLCM